MLRYAGAAAKTLNNRFKGLLGWAGKPHAAAGVDVELIVTVGLAQEGKVTPAGFGTGTPRAETCVA